MNESSESDEECGERRAGPESVAPMIALTIAARIAPALPAAPLPVRGRRRRGPSPLPSIFPALALLALLVVSGASPCRGQTEVGGAGDTALGVPGLLAPRAPSIDPVDLEAIERGLDYLAARTSMSGSIGAKYPVAVSSLAGLAALGAGYRYPRYGGGSGGPGRGESGRSSAAARAERYGSMLRGILEYLLAKEHKAYGYIAESLDNSGSRMHGHCFALLFLTQVYGELSAVKQAEVRPVIRRAIRCIAAAQSRLGGWWYRHTNPDDMDEASVTIGALQALRAARNIGFQVPRDCILRARRYVERCQVLPGGGFRYSLRGGQQRTSFALTAAAIATLNALGTYDSKLIDDGFRYMDGLLSAARGRPHAAISEPFFFYGALYATEAYFQRGGDRWKRWFGGMRRYLLGRQQGDGRWKDSYGDEFATAVAILILEMPIRYLPIFER